MAVVRFEVYLVPLDPTVGSEIRKTRPCVVVSPDDMNARMRTVLVAPLTSGGKPYPFRVASRFDGVDGLVLLDQIRSVDQRRLIRKLGSVDKSTGRVILQVLQAMFAE